MYLRRSPRPRRHRNILARCRRAAPRLFSDGSSCCAVILARCRRSVCSRTKSPHRPHRLAIGSWSVAPAMEDRKRCATTDARPRHLRNGACSRRHVTVQHRRPGYPGPGRVRAVARYSFRRYDLRVAGGLAANEAGLVARAAPEAATTECRSAPCGSGAFAGRAITRREHRATAVRGSTRVNPFIP